VRDLEQKAVLLEAKNTSLNEELKSYQAYMKDAITQYKRQIGSLTTQLRDRQGVARDDGSAENLRLPSIGVSNSTYCRRYASLRSNESLVSEPSAGAMKTSSSRPSSKEANQPERESRLPSISKLNTGPSET
jgi:hypothetical protein